jgi:hypothetical protein
MGPMKRFPPVVLFVMVAALVAGLAPAASTSPTGAAKLKPVGDEPSASGYATVVRVPQGRWGFGWRLSVNCSGLTPGAPYYLAFPRSPTSPASSEGTWGTWGVLFSSSPPTTVSVFRLDPDRGNVLVLSGTFVWH